MLKQNLTNHFIFILDKSSSMRGLTDQVIKAMDQQVASLVKMSKELDQETRVSIYTFSDSNDIKNVVFDMDVMRYTTIRGQYDPYGNTALLDAVAKGYDDLQSISQKYSEHAFVLVVITDGEENNSIHYSRNLPQNFARLIETAPDNVTFSAMVPSNGHKRNIIKFGFDEGNVAVWEVSDKGIEKQTEIINQSLGNYMVTRAMTGIKKSSNLFQVNTASITQTDVRKAATPLTEHYHIVKVPANLPEKTWISKFMESTVGYYKLGKSYYQLTKPEKIQANKSIILRDRKTSTLYHGPYVRQLINLPNYELKVSPGDYGDWDIFVQSTSINRYLQPNTDVISLL